MSIQNRELQLLKKEEYPKFNGHEIKSIYMFYENSRYSDTIDGRGYIADVIYYKCYYSYYDNEKNEIIETHLKVKNLPEPFNLFMGKIIQNKNRNFFVKDFCIRTSTSGHANPDNTLSLWGWAGNATTETAHMYRGLKMDTPENNYVLDCDKGIGKHILDNIVGKEFQVEVVEFSQCGSNMKEGTLDFATKYPYPHTPIRIIDCCVYRDEKLPSWRWMHHMPYVEPNDCFDKKNIRVWDDNSRCHLYLTKAIDLEVGDTNLVQVSFSSKRHDLYGSEGSAYCDIRRFNNEYNFEYVRFEVTEKLKDGSFKGKVTNPKNKFNEREQELYPSDLYYINRISYSITHADKSNEK